MKRLVIIFSLFVIFQIVYGQDDSGKYIKYAELQLTNYHDPYVRGNLVHREDYRLYALYHETLFENVGGKYQPNFTYREKEKGGLRKWIQMVNKDDLLADVKSEFLMKIPKEIERTYKFHDGTVVRDDDIVFSIKYAINKKILDNTLFIANNVYIDKNGDLHISFPYELALETIVQYLGNVFVLPKPSNNKSAQSFDLDIGKERIGAGPFIITNIEEEKLSLTFFEDYRSNRLFDGITIRQILLRTEMVKRMDESKDLNLIIDIPFTLFGDAYKPGHYRQKIPRLSAGVLLINHTNQHLGTNKDSKKFREAISLAIDRNTIISGEFYGDGDPLYGPFPRRSNYYDPVVRPMRYNLKKAKDMLKSIPGYSYNKKGRLVYKGKTVQLSLIYPAGKSYPVVNALESIASKLEALGLVINGPKNKQIVVWDPTLKDPNKWDLAYWDYYPKPAAVLEDIYYSESDKNFQNYSNPRVNKLYSEFSTAVEITRKNDIGVNIYRELKEDFASIYLWSLYDWYQFDKTEIHIDASTKIDGEAFFGTPHLWRPAE